MKHIKTFRVFESEGDPNMLYDHFGITYEQVGDIIQDLLDVEGDLTYRIEVRPKEKDGLFGEVDHFIIFIESKFAFDDTVFLPMIEQVDELLQMYGLEIFYVSPLAKRSIGENIFVKRISDDYKVCNKIPRIHDPSEDEDSEALGMVASIDGPRPSAKPSPSIG